MAEANAWLDLERSAPDETDVVLRAGGSWTVDNSAALDARLTSLEPGAWRRVVVDLSGVSRFDSAGAWLLHRTLKRWRGAGVSVAPPSLSPEQEVLLAAVAEHDPSSSAEPSRRRSLLERIAALGAATERGLRDVAVFIAFFGESCLALARTVVQPRRLRFTSLVLHMERHGLDALPIVSLISFLIGIVIAYQGFAQLRNFGADVFVVDLIGLAVVRELGILLAAVVVAGRTGSSFTAQLGSMKIEQEVDALHTMGLDPMEVLVLPRVLALVLTLPMLAFFADLFGLIGGGLMCWAAFGIDPRAYLERLRDAVDLWSFWVGVIKAPVFGWMIALVGCFEGMRVGGSAESLGLHTTRSVVESIFLVIVLDAMFSIFFNVIGV